jgi:ferric-dicitrate binding protein FerR (iron transport regulator)
MSAAEAQSVKQVDASRELQWATGYYEFRGETVSQAIEEFNRRNRLQIVMSDAAIGAIAMPFTTVKLDDPESFVVMLAARPDVQVAYESANVIRLLPE